MKPLEPSPSNASAALFARLAEAVRCRLGHRFPPMGRAAYQTFFKLLPRDIDIELLPGIRAELNTDDGTQRATYWQGARFEHPTPAILKKWIAGPEAIFFDIGSNYGWFSFYFSSVLPWLQIYSFEPNPTTFEHLQRIVSRNHLSNIHPYNLGLGEEVMTGHLRIGIEDSGHSTFGPHPGLTDQNAVEITIRPFDAWRLEVGLDLPAQPSWVAKIDVEGFECRVITGMQEALTARAFRGLAVEVNPPTLKFCGDSPSKLISLLSKLGYVERTPEFPGEQNQLNKFFVPRE